MQSSASGTVVLDASAVVRIIEGSPQAAPLRQVLADAALVVAPELMLTEVANALWRLHRAGELPLKDLQPQLAAAAELVDHIEPDRHLQVEALALACHLNHPVYDCLYLALARREAAAVLTADKRLMALAEQVLP